MTTPRFLALQKEWKRHPPVAWLVAAFVGYKPPPERLTTAPAQGDGVASLKAAFPDGRIV